MFSLFEVERWTLNVRRSFSFYGPKFDLNRQDAKERQEETILFIHPI